MATGDKTEIDEEVAASIRNFSARAKDDPARPRTTIELPDFIEEKAARISAHFLLPAGARIVDMGCATGEVTYVLAQLNPRAEVIGVDRDPSVIAFAAKTFRLPNLTFLQSDISIPDIADNAIDAIVNSNILHGVYADAGYNPDEIGRLLEKQARKLKTGGTMLIRDYMMPPEDEFVLLEFPSARSKGKDVAQLSDADLLLRFSHTARPLPGGGAEGFRIEEIAPKRPDTRLFRLPHKWAIEFIHRKDSRAVWNKTLREEYTFFTWQDYARECSKIGMRMVFSSPYANPWVVKNRFRGKFQLYSEDGRALGMPATNHFIVAQKVADRQSLLLEERRPSPAPAGDLQVMLVRDKKSGVVHELVRRPGEYCDVIPYRVTSDNRLAVYVRSGYPRPIVNAGLHGGHNLDGKKWSG
ncbi:MAG: methyltransferase domain-containing protein, partial [Alphaproteobacteria bacterium]|nr:methyltransferase domain-containing protein [Alphaproteobacteria bacterium]